MEPRTEAQDLMRCDLCETAVVQMHCDTCLANMCTACVGEHFSADLSKPHKIVKFHARKSIYIYPACKTHYKQKCTMHCIHCGIHVCTKCIASDQHIGHKLSEILQIVDETKNKFLKQQTELNETIYPAYQDIASDVQNRMSQLEKEYGDLSTAVTKHGQDWHREIDKIVTKLRAEVDEMKNIQLQILQKHLDEINKKISEIKDEIKSIDVAMDSNDISKVFSVTFDVDIFRSLPQNILPSLPQFTPGEIRGEELHKIFGTLSSNEDRMNITEKSTEAGSSLPVKELLDEPETITTIHTGYEYLYNVVYLSDDKIWTRGEGNTMKLYSVSQDSQLKSITTKSGNRPTDITVTKGGDLFYINDRDGTMNIVKNEKIEEVIRLQKWRPYTICSTSSGDLLVIMESNDKNQTKVVRYSGSTEKQTIQLDDEDKSLYSSLKSMFFFRYRYNYITENRNLDICLSDCEAKAVMVFNQSGKLKLRYLGHTPAPRNQPFSPQGIATDSQSHILIADNNNECVHIIDQDGKFLRFIVCRLSNPYGMCTDTNDNLFVAQRGNKQVKKIKYLQ